MAIIPSIAAGGSGGGLFIPESATTPFNSINQRDNWAENNLSDLVSNVSVVNVGGNSWYLWMGETSPDTYDSNGWAEGDRVVKGSDGSQGEKGDTGDFGQIEFVDIVGDDFVFTDNNGNTATLIGAVLELQGSQGIQGIQGATGDFGQIVFAEFDGDDIVFTDNTNNTASLIGAVQRLRGDRGEAGSTGAPFKIEKTYSSVAEMEADFGGVDVLENEMALINTIDPNDDDNAKIFIKGSAQWDFLTDLSGAVGIKGEDGRDGDNGQEGADGVGIVGVEIVNNDLLVELTSGATDNAGRVVGDSAADVWRNLGNAGDDQAFIDYLRERITFNGNEIESIGFANDSGLSGGVDGDQLNLDCIIVGDPLVDVDAPDYTAPTDQLIVRPFRYTSDMPDHLLVECEKGSLILDTFPSATSYMFEPNAHNVFSVSGRSAQYTVSAAQGDELPNSPYSMMPMFKIQPDTTVGFRDNRGYFRFPENVPVDVTNGFYLTGVMSGYYADATDATAFIYIGNDPNDYQNGTAIGLKFNASGASVIDGNSDVNISTDFTYNANNGQPVFYRFAIFVTSGNIHYYVKNTTNDQFVNGTMAVNIESGDDKRVYCGVDRGGSSSTVAFGKISLWLPSNEQMNRVNFRG